MAAGRETLLLPRVCHNTLLTTIFEYGFTADLTPPHTPHFTLHHTLTLGPFSATKNKKEFNPMRIMDFFMAA
jgi:hypothetical protein